MTNPEDPSTTFFETWRRKFAWSTGLGLTDEQSKQRDNELRWDKCNQWKRHILATSPKVVFMLDHLDQLGAKVKSSNIHCVPCTGQQAGGTDAVSGNIAMCQGKFLSRKHMEDTLTHELLHLYDHARFKVDWSNLRHHACSEIRAENLSGDCRWGREIQRGVVSFTKQHQECVRRRAILSVRGNAACPDEATAERAVNEVFDSCLKDTRPFDEIY